MFDKGKSDLSDINYAHMNLFDKEKKGEGIEGKRGLACPKFSCLLHKLQT